MVLENLAVEVEETFFKTLEVILVDCGEVGWEVFSEHDVRRNNADSPDGLQVICDSFGNIHAK